MPHDTPLLVTLVAGLCSALVLGVIAQRIGISPLVGYLLAGVAVGPFTPGLVIDQAIAQELAELGIILLMFGVGLHFSLSDLLSVLIVEDLAMVLALVLLPALGRLLSPEDESGLRPGALAIALATTLGKIAAFVALMLIVGRRVIPWVLAHIAGGGSRELFRLAVLSIALGVASEPPNSSTCPSRWARSSPAWC